MARQKQVSIESVYNDFELLDLADKVETSKLILGHLEDQKKLQQNAIEEAQNSIAKLDEVVKTA